MTCARWQKGPEWPVFASLLWTPHYPWIKLDCRAPTTERAGWTKLGIFGKLLKMASETRNELRKCLRDKNTVLWPTVRNVPPRIHLTATSESSNKSYLTIRTSISPFSILLLRHHKTKPHSVPEFSWTKSTAFSWPTSQNSVKKDQISMKWLHTEFMLETDDNFLS